MNSINIVRPFLPNIDEIYSDFSECLVTGMVTNGGKHVQKLESNLSSFFNKNSNIENFVSVFCNGEMAFYNLINCIANDIGEEGFDVIVPSFTFVGTINAIVANGLNPVFCDVDDTFTIDLNSIDMEKTKNARMIIAVGAYGNLPNLSSLKQFSEKNNLRAILDNAPAFGSTYKGLFSSSFGFDEIYSFHASKIFNTMEGGAVVTSNQKIHQRLLNLRDFGQFDKSTGNVNSPGLNTKMQEISAIVGNKNLEKIDYIFNKRRKNIEIYKDGFQKLSAKYNIQLMRVDQNVDCMYLYFPIVLPEEIDREDFINSLHSEGVSCRRYYTAVHDLDFYRDRNYICMDIDHTKKIMNKIVSLPLHTEMSMDEISLILNSVEKSLKS